MDKDIEETDLAVGAVGSEGERRIYQNIEEVRAAVRTYYNHHWLLEKNGYRSPAETRRHWMAATITTHEAA